MTDYFDHLTFEDRQFILWVKSPKFSYDYVLRLNEYHPPFEILFLALFLYAITLSPRFTLLPPAISV